MSLKTKIISGYVVVLLIFCLVVSLVIFDLRSVLMDSRELKDQVIPNNDLSAEAKYTLAMEAVAIMDYSFGGNDGAWNQAMSIRNLNQEELAKLKHLVQEVKDTNPELVKLEADLTRLYDDFEAKTSGLPALMAAMDGDMTKAIEKHRSFDSLLEEYTQPQMAKLSGGLTYVANVDELKRLLTVVEKIHDFSDESGDFFEDVLYAVYEKNLSLLEASIAQGDRVLKNLSEFRDQAGNLNEKAQLTNLTATFSDCLMAVKSLRVNLQATLTDKVGRDQARDAALDSIDKFSDRLSEMTIEFAQETITLVDQAWMILVIGLSVAFLLSLGISWVSSSSLSKHLKDITEQLTNGSEEVERAAMELSQASNQVANGTSQNATALEQTSAAIEELSSMTARNSENAAMAKNLITSASDSVKHSERAMDKVIEAMNQIADSGNEIGKIIKTIDEIAFQTNLLALNAAVEAARAGESGAGFAVVADEVRNLAIRSADAAKNTADLIDKTIENITMGSSLVKQTYDGFGALVTDVSQVSEIIEGVAAASSDQRQGISQITIAIQEMDQVTQKNAAVSEQTAGAANSLTNEAKVLDENSQRLDVLVNGSKKSRFGALFSNNGSAPRESKTSNGYNLGDFSRPRLTGHYLPLDE
ncbi:MAG: methyl-accepting chemotaxis protein [Deltaproteobacteria bacterium]|jgi:methyl-accepting chemotaxis protein|nr:methyl-accepting chemotaxis protein [Deltaproteobacteria bacterium]